MPSIRLAALEGLCLVVRAGVAISKTDFEAIAMTVDSSSEIRDVTTRAADTCGVVRPQRTARDPRKIVGWILGDRSRVCALHRRDRSGPARAGSSA